MLVLLNLVAFVLEQSHFTVQPFWRPLPADKLKAPFSMVQECLCLCLDWQSSFEESNSAAKLRKPEDPIDELNHGAQH